MKETVYERYGLSSNPFRDLSSESLENIDIFHVTQAVDEELTRMKEEIIYKENKAVVGVLGGLGAGKTERMLLAANEASSQGLFYIMANMTFETQWVIEGVLDSIINNKKIGLFSRLFSSPKWLKEVYKLKKVSKTGYDPERAGRVIAEALNSNAPSFLFINDFHHLSHALDSQRFLHVLHVLVDHIRHGVMIMIVSDLKFFQGLMKNHPSLNERINRKIIVPPLSDDEANLIIAKRLLEKRIVDDIEPLYPFTDDGIRLLNTEVKGNPRHLLKLADVVIEYAARKRAIMIDESIVHEIVTLGKNKQLHVEFDDKEPVIQSIPQGNPMYTPSIQPASPKKRLSLLKRSKQKNSGKQQPIEYGKPFNYTSSNATTSSSSPSLQQYDKSNEPVFPPITNDINSFDHYDDQVESYSPSDESIQESFDDDSAECIQVDSSYSLSKSSAKKNNPDTKKKGSHSSKSKKPKNSAKKPSKSVSKATSNKTSVKSEVKTLVKPAKKTESSFVKIKCPECSKIFAMEIDESTKTLTCPYCKFVGDVSD
jgi:type II secretory pathway predicted ATPase ExeA/ribosomal protein S27E